jgi:hypothetical protein
MNPATRFLSNRLDLYNRGRPQPREKRGHSVALLGADWRGCGDGGPMRRGGSYIAIEGPIGVGKTSLAQPLGLKNRRKNCAQRYQE